MNVSTHTIRRLVSVTGLAVVVAALAVPTALSRPTIEGGDVAYRTPVVLDLRSPDTRDVKTLAPGCRSRDRNRDGRAPAPGYGR